MSISVVSDRVRRIRGRAAAAAVVAAAVAKFRANCSVGVVDVGICEKKISALISRQKT